MSLEHDAERGRMAAEVLNNPVYAESYGLIEQEIYRQWRDTRDKDERERLHCLLLMLGKARIVLEGTMRSGKVAMAELQKRQSLSERIGLRRKRD